MLKAIPTGPPPEPVGIYIMYFYRRVSSIVCKRKARQALADSFKCPAARFLVSRTRVSDAPSATSTQSWLVAERAGFLHGPRPSVEVNYSSSFSNQLGDEIQRGRGIHRHFVAKQCGSFAILRHILVVVEECR